MYVRKRESHRSIQSGGPPYSSAEEKDFYYYLNHSVEDGGANES